MIKKEYAECLKRHRYFIGSDEYLKLYGVLFDGSAIRIKKKVVDLTQDELDKELLWVQQTKEAEFDNRTSDLFSEGVDYNSGAATFSMSTAAWINWLDIRYKKDLLLLTYPFDVSCWSGSYSIKDATECQDILDLVFGSKETILASGRSLVDQVYSKSTIAEVEAVSEGR